MSNPHGNGGFGHRIFKTPEEMQAKIDEYFDNEERTTVTGLCLHLGFRSRQGLNNYEKYSKEFYDVIKTAKMRVEMYYEKRLIEGKAAGSIFALKQFGWTDRQELDVKGKGIKLEIVNFRDKEEKKKDKD